MLPFLEELLEKKLSNALGAKVTFDRVKVSPLSGKVEVINLVASARGEAKPFLSVARIEAKVAMARALKQEIVIQSLRIERPVLRLPLPVLNKGAADRKDGSKPWSFEADNVLVVDGSAEFHSHIYHATAEGLRLSLKREDGNIVLTLLVDVLRRVDADARMGPLKAMGQFATTDFAQLPAAAVALAGELEPGLRFSITAAALRSKAIDAQLDGIIDAALLLKFLPRPSQSIPMISGEIHLSMAGTFSPNEIALRRLDIRSADMNAAPPRDI